MYVREDEGGGGGFVNEKIFMKMCALHVSHYV